MEMTSSASSVSTQEQAIHAISEAIRNGIKPVDLRTLRPGSKPDETTFPPSINGEHEKELCRKVVEAVIEHIAELIPDTPTPLIPPPDEFDVRFMPRSGWNWCTITSTDFYHTLGNLVDFCGRTLAPNA